MISILGIFVLVLIVMNVMWYVASQYSLTPKVYNFLKAMLVTAICLDWIAMILLIVYIKDHYHVGL